MTQQGQTLGLEKNLAVSKNVMRRLWVWKTEPVSKNVKKGQDGLEKMCETLRGLDGAGANTISHSVS